MLFTKLLKLQILQSPIENYSGYLRNQKAYYDRHMIGFIFSYLGVTSFLFYSVYFFLSSFSNIAHGYSIKFAFTFGVVLSTLLNLRCATFYLYTWRRWRNTKLVFLQKKVSEGNAQIQEKDIPDLEKRFSWEIQKKITDKINLATDADFVEMWRKDGYTEDEIVNKARAKGIHLQEIITVNHGDYEKYFLKKLEVGEWEVTGIEKYHEDEDFQSEGIMPFLKSLFKRNKKPIARGEGFDRSIRQQYNYERLITNYSRLLTFLVIGHGVSILFLAVSLYALFTLRGYHTGLPLGSLMKTGISVMILLVSSGTISYAIKQYTLFRHGRNKVISQYQRWNKMVLEAVRGAGEGAFRAIEERIKREKRKEEQAKIDARKKREHEIGIIEAELTSKVNEKYAIEKDFEMQISRITDNVEQKRIEELKDIKIGKIQKEINDLRQKMESM